MEIKKRVVVEWVLQVAHAFTYNPTFSLAFPTTWLRRGFLSGSRHVKDKIREIGISLGRV